MNQASAALEPDWSGALAERIDHLAESLATYLTSEQVATVREACEFGAEAHAGVYRKSGEPYIFHPIAVAEILVEVRFDHETIIAAILHDVIEDTDHDKETLSHRFGSEVAELVDGVSKLMLISFSSRQEAQAENFRKMFMAMAKDIRVIMIKLADRLHNMRTLGAMPAAKRHRIARETLDIYAPIAMRLGMNHMRVQLEDLGFQHLYPLRYKVLQNELQKRRGHRKEVISQLETRIRERLEEVGIKARVVGRQKHLWSIYKKMKTKHIRWREINDVFAVRVIVGHSANPQTDAEVDSDVDTCYRVLGHLHGLYKPVMGRFKDYIAIPKDNGYQSLHTVLFGPQGLAIEAQIRTKDMHVIAQTGVAAHWLYKAGSKASHAHDRAREWLQKLLDIHRRAGSSMEFMESVKVDLFPNEIYVFTPTGEIVELPRGASVVDFAYAIHSDVGNTCVGAKADSRFVPLRTKLSSGQTVEVIISPTARPDPAWLGFVVTAKARASIRHYLKHLQREEAVMLGKRLLEKSLPGGRRRLKEISEEKLQAVVKQLRAANYDEILADIGLGKRLAAIIAKHLVTDDSDNTEPGGRAEQPLLIQGTEGAVISFGKCCRPIPGDEIVGHLSAGRGIVVHRDTCKNVSDYDKAPDKWLEVQWEDSIESEFAVALRLEANNRRGVLAAIAVAIGNAEANIDTINTADRDGVNTAIDLILNVHDRGHLARVMRQLRTVPGVLRIFRRT